MVTTSNSQQAYLIAYNFDGSQSIGYITKDFSEVYKFKSICKSHGIAYSVRFKQVEINESTYIHKGKEGCKSGIKSIVDFFIKPWGFS